MSRFIQFQRMRVTAMLPAAFLRTVVGGRIVSRFAA
jgi:hypothetical protein